MCQSLLLIIVRVKNIISLITKTQFIVLLLYPVLFCCYEVRQRLPLRYCFPSAFSLNLLDVLLHFLSLVGFVNSLIDFRQCRITKRFPTSFQSLECIRHYFINKVRIYVFTLLTRKTELEHHYILSHVLAFVQSLSKRTEDPSFEDEAQRID